MGRCNSDTVEFDLCGNESFERVDSSKVAGENIARAGLRYLRDSVSILLWLSGGRSGAMLATSWEFRGSTSECEGRGSVFAS